jgi:hypothetical protein
MELRSDILERPRLGHTQVASLWSDSIPIDTQSVMLTVNGNRFIPQAQITWDGNPLPTTFIDSHHLQTAITQQTFISFEAFVGNSVQIAVSSQLFFEIWDVQSAGTRPHPS